MRQVNWWLAGSMALLALGCSGGTQSPILPGTPESPQATPSPANPVAGIPAPVNGSANLGGASLAGDMAQSALALYTIDLDPTALSAGSSLKAVREGQANDALTDLSIARFLTPTSFVVDGVTATATTIDVHFTFTHPYAAGTLSQPASAANRADLGAVVRAVVLADVTDGPANTYFEGDDPVTLNSTLMTNADAYMRPAGLLDTTGFTADTFPYVMLVDETLDNREGVSNGGLTTGNYDALTGGWQQGNFPDWTGYGVLHQGQKASQVISLDKAALAAGETYTFDVALVAKYLQPKSAKPNKLPLSPMDALAFSYRMPHGAADGEAISFEGEGGGFQADFATTSELRFHVRDWDARATDTAAATLAEDTDVSTTEVGESGAPYLEVSIPGVLGATGQGTLDPLTDLYIDDLAYGGDIDEDSGAAGDELFYAAVISKSSATGQTSGDHTGVVRVVDPEIALDRSSWSFGLDEAGALLTPVDAPLPITYQVFTVNQTPANFPPSATANLTSADPLLSGDSAAILVSSIADPDNTPLDIMVDWGDGNGFVTAVTALASPYPAQPLTSPTTFDNLDLVDDAITIQVQITDGIAAPVSAGSLSFDVGPNRAPIISGTPALAVATIQAPATFTMNQSTAGAIDPEGDTITYVVTSNISPLGPFGPVVGDFPVTGIGPYVAAGTVGLSLWARDPLHANLVPLQADSATKFPAINGTVAACPVVTYGATNVATFWTTTGGALNAANGNQWGWLDVGSITTPNTPLNGFVTVNNTGSGTTPAFTTQNFQRVTSPLAGAPVRTSITAFGASPINGASTILGVSIHQIEVDPTGRVLFLTRGINGDDRNLGGINTDGTAGIYDVAGAAHAGIKWFDYNFETNPAAVTSLGGTIVTGASIPVAIVVDKVAPDYAVWTIDTVHMLRRYIRSSPTTYTEDVSSAVNLVPIIGANTGTGDTNRKVHDLVHDHYTGAFFILVQSQAAATAPGNGYVYRVECNGSFNANLTGPATNPVRFILSNTATQNQGADILLDQTTAAGALLGAQSGAQIMVGTYNTVAGNPEIRIFNTNLLQTATAETGKFSSILGVSFNHGFLSKGNQIFNNLDYYLPGTKPAPWL